MAQPSEGGFAGVLHRESFPAFLAAGAAQFAGPSTAFVVLIFSVAVAYPRADSSFVAVALALMGLSSALPTLAGAFFAGPLADRHDRHLLMRTANLVSLVATALLAVDLFFAPSKKVALPLLPGFYLPLWLLLLYPVWAGLITTATLFRPAYNTSVPKFVSTAELGRANGLIYAIAAAVSAGGTLLVGVVLTLGGSVLALSIPFVLFLATQVALLLVTTDLKVRREGTPPKILRFAAEGLSYLVRRRDLFEVTIAALFVNLLAAVAFVELGLFVRDSLGLLSGIWYGAMISASTAGAACGLLAISRIPFEKHAGLWLIVLVLAMGGALSALSFVRNIWLALPIIFVYGLMPGMIQTVFLSAVQATVPDEVMGRVFAADEVGSYMLVPVGQSLGGLLAVEVGVEGAYLFAGGSMVALGVVMLGTFGSLRGLRIRVDEPGAGPTAS